MTGTKERKMKEWKNGEIKYKNKEKERKKERKKEVKKPLRACLRSKLPYLQEL